MNLRVAMCGYVWLCVAMFGYVWLCSVMCGYVWLCVAMFGYLWLCSVMCGYVWLCVAMFGYVWLCSVMCGYMPYGAPASSERPTRSRTACTARPSAASPKGPTDDGETHAGQGGGAGR